MSEIVNLNKARKERDRTEAKAQADANAVKFGRTKAQRMLEAAQQDLQRKRLDSLKFDEE